MNATETARICRAIAGLKPAQHFDDETPAFWALVLADVDFDDAKQAVVNLATRSRFIDPSDIVTEVKAIRDDRLDRVEIPTPNANPDDIPAYLAEQRALLAAIRDNTLTGDRMDAYRRGEIALTGPPALTGPRSAPDPDTGPAIVRAVVERQRLARLALAAAQAEADAANRAALHAELVRQQAALDALDVLAGQDGQR